jgi:hypothetical protein
MATRVYYKQQLDYDDYPVGSPGQMFSNVDEAKKSLDGARSTWTLQSRVVWDSVDEYIRWMNGDDSIYPKDESVVTKEAS